MNQFLHALARVAQMKRQRDLLLQRASKGQLNSIRNICFNLCKKKFNLSAKTKRKLKVYCKDIRDLASKKKLKSTTGLRRRLLQRGGFLPILLPAILGLLSSVGGKVLERAIGV